MKFIVKIFVWLLVVVLFFVPAIYVIYFKPDIDLLMAESIISLSLVLFLIFWIIMLTSPSFASRFLDFISFPFTQNTMTKRRTKHLTKMKQKKYVRLKTKHNNT